MITDMSKTIKIEFSSLVSELNQRAHRSVVSQFGFRNEALNRYLSKILSANPEKKVHFLPTRVFEATFGYKGTDTTMEALSGNLFEPAVIEALDNPPKKYSKEYTFKKTIPPYSHQINAWKTLMADDWKSTLVSSGTGSGKTECFLFPILNDLAQEQAVNNDKIEGVRALFLYPLNALIKSQRDRLAAWTANFDGNIRFCLYNGETKYTVPAKDERNEPQEVKSRKSLRRSPPPILVTNTTMLEYMLVRKDDQPILQASHGKLRWIVLDEAHSYVGSQAAELSLLLRRVMIAFGVDRDDVRFVATSATIGGNDEKANNELKQFLADMAGVDPSQVAVIRGGRQVPAITLEPNDTQSIYTQPADTLSWTALAKNMGAQNLRTYVSNEPRTLSEIRKHLAITWPEITQQEALHFLDTLTAVKGNDGQAFLPLRAHIFEKTFGGLWACSNNQCTGKTNSPLMADEWNFGAVYFNQHDFCTHCKAPVFEITSCNSCGTEYLNAEYQRSQAGFELKPKRQQSIDEFHLDIDHENAGTEGDAIRTNMNRRLISPLSTGATDSLFFSSWEITEPGNGDFPVYLLSPKLKDDGEILQCARCLDKERVNRKLFFPKRLGAPFFLGDILPTVLEYCPPGDKYTRFGPSQGRRLLTFTDSRQGTARIAARLQQSTDRNFIRSIAYNAVAPVISHNNNGATTSPKEISALKESYEANKDNPLLGPLILQSLEEKEAILLASEQPQIETPALSWTALKETLTKDKDISGLMGTNFNRVSGKHLTKEEFADYCIYREFARRPKRGAQSELLGLVKLEYPAIKKLARAPELWLRQGASLEEWKDFLHLIADHFLRENSIVNIPEDFRKWMGAKISFKFVVAPHVEREDYSRKTRPWPKCYRGNKIRNRLINIALNVLNLSSENEEDCRIMDLILEEAWISMEPLMDKFSNGRQLNMERSVEFCSVTEAYHCPYTRRIVPLTLRGYSPYTVTDGRTEMEVCEKVTLPVLPVRYWEVAGDKKKVKAEFIESNPEIKALREKWLWPNRSDRALSMESWFAVGEHSAQQSSSRLDQLEKEFKEGKVNVLSCSTTMEMGVDIGGMSAIVMNNVPPSQANYQQRAGRAGRRQEATSLCVTLCKQTAHGMEVFNNPKWPFDTSSMEVPKVEVNSRLIAQRHVNALLLSEWLRRFNQDIPKLNCSWFFEETDFEGFTRCHLFRIWCENLHLGSDKPVIKSVTQLVHNTILASTSPTELMLNAAEKVRDLSGQWQKDAHVFIRQREEIVQGTTKNESLPAVRSIDRQLKRIREEYLLKDLTTNGLLPGHGFPSGIVDMLTSTVKDFQKKGQDKESRNRIDQKALFRGNPSRQRAIAIREFAPGTDIVLDGAVYQSSGVTLNWHIPAGVEAQPEDLSIRWLWFCKSCGAGDTSKVMPSFCSACEGTKLKIQRIVEPNGFAVDLFYEAHNDINTAAYLPVNPPRVNISSGDFRRFSNPLLGRFRYSDQGAILSYNAGKDGLGYSMCLYCGRAEPQGEQGKIPKKLIDPPHSRLRGGKERDHEEHCPGNDSDWAIKTDLWLAGEDITSVIELRLTDPVSQSPIIDKETAWSLGYALRFGLVQKLGISAQEVSVAVQEVADPTHHIIYAIYLYDMATSGAGYVAQLASYLDDIVDNAIGLLDCVDECDSACSSCLLDWDSQHQADLIDRNSAATFLKQWKKYMVLPAALKAICDDAKAELSGIAASLRLNTFNKKPKSISLFLDDNPEEWDLLNWPLLTDLQRWSAEAVTVRLLSPQGSFDRMQPSQRRILLAMNEISQNNLEFGEVQVENRIIDDVRILVMVEMEQPRFWATANPVLQAGEDWGHCDYVLISGTQKFDLPYTKCDLSFDEASADPSVIGSTRIKITRECDGSLKDFGGKLWKTINAEMAKEPGKNALLTEVYYRDRYLVTPLHAALLHQMIKPLLASMTSQTRIEIETADLKIDHHKTPSSLSDNWANREVRNDVLKGVIEEITSRKVYLNSNDRRNVAHSRELVLKWDSGETLQIFMDEGLGCWRTNSYQHFDFSSSVMAQIKSICSASCYIQIAQSNLGTHLFAAN